MTSSGQSHEERQSSAHRLLRHAILILFPPTGKILRTRYHRKNGLLFFDTLLSLVVLFLLGTTIVFVSEQASIIQYPMLRMPPTHRLAATRGEILFPVNTTQEFVTPDESSATKEEMDGAMTPPRFFSAEARYHGEAGIQFGYGPIPPRVGEQTGYRIFWGVEAGTDALSNAQIRATLPDRVGWGGHEAVSFGRRFVRQGPSVVWEIGDLDARDGRVMGSFEITVTPKKSDLGKTLILLSLSTLSVQADGEERETVLTAPQLTSQIPGQKKDQGIVQGQ